MLFILKMVKCGYLKVYFCKVGIKNDSKRINIIVFYKNGLKNPSVLATSAEISDIYDNMIKKTEKIFGRKIRRK
ncbi:MAG: hypothetical protein Q9M97_09710 [Candidatus Gracilibacteria bacterium]|nr:hypothetical protein [Candidatus Gracilibacteria bacterium]